MSCLSVVLLIAGLYGVPGLPSTCEEQEESSMLQSRRTHSLELVQEKADCGCGWIINNEAGCVDNNSTCGKACCDCTGTKDCTCNWSCEGTTPDGTCCYNACCGANIPAPSPSLVEESADCGCGWIINNEAGCVDNNSTCGKACCDCKGTKDCTCDWSCEGTTPDGSCCYNACCGANIPAPSPGPVDCGCGWIINNEPGCVDNPTPCGEACCDCTGTKDCTCNFDCEGTTPDGSCCYNACCGANISATPSPSLVEESADCGCGWIINNEAGCVDNNSTCGKACCDCTGTKDCTCDWSCEGTTPDGTCCYNACCGTTAP